MPSQFRQALGKRVSLCREFGRAALRKLFQVPKLPADSGKVLKMTDVQQIPLRRIADQRQKECALVGIKRARQFFQL